MLIHCHRMLKRRGAALVESTIVLMVCLLLLLGMLELSLVLVRHTAMAEAARRAARAAIVRGDRCGSVGPWGPTGITIDANADHPAAIAVRDVLLTLSPADVQIELTWPDGDDRPEQRLRAVVSTTHHPVVTLPGWYQQIELRAESTMRIAH